jgi:hypothetical protein
MSDRPVAPCADLPTMVKAYPADKKVPVVVPLKAFEAVAGGNGASVDPGVEVEIVGALTWQRKPDPASGRADGRVKRILVEVEVDLATFEQGQHAGQGTLT